MHLKLRCLLLAIVVCSVHFYPCIAQKKGTETRKATQPLQAETKKEAIPAAISQNITIIREVLPAKEKQKAEEITPLFETKETVIIIKKNKTGPATSNKKIDTVIVVVKDTASAKPVATTQKTKPTEEKPAKDERPGKVPSLETDTKGNCGCVDMLVKTMDTLEYEQYINYTVIFKNNCKETVYINSASFRFIPFNYFGNPVRELRKVSFVKRFDVPPFVRLDPNEVYEFKFADDPFFQFDLRRHEQYRFNFVHSNKDQKYKAAPTKTYLCSRYEEKMIFVK